MSLSNIGDKDKKQMQNIWPIYNKLLSEIIAV